jgi:hypothetical protein
MVHRFNLQLDFVIKCQCSIECGCFASVATSVPKKGTTRLRNAKVSITAAMIKEKPLK